MGWMLWPTHTPLVLEGHSHLVLQGPVKKWACRARPPAKPPWVIKDPTLATSTLEHQDSHLCNNNSNSSNSSNNNNSSNSSTLGDSTDSLIQALVAPHRDK